MKRHQRSARCRKSEEIEMRKSDNQEEVYSELKNPEHYCQWLLSMTKVVQQKRFLLYNLLLHWCMLSGEIKLGERREGE